jgi:ketosteroid isomerase-like protein
MTDLLAELNRDIWHPFTAAYAALDPDAFMALNHPDVVHISGAGNQINGHAEYAGQIREFFARVAARGDRIGIDFRFHERIASGDLASERGLFRLSVVPADGELRTRYGRFHTVARKAGGRWRFSVDYDTDEGADQTAFDAAAAVDDLARFAS